MLQLNKMSTIFLSPKSPSCGRPLERMMDFPAVIIQDVQAVPIPEGLYFVSEEVSFRRNFPQGVLAEFDEKKHRLEYARGCWREPWLGDRFLKRDGSNIWKITKIADMPEGPEWAYSKMIDHTPQVRQAVDEFLEYFELLATASFPSDNIVDVEEMLGTSWFGEGRTRQSVFFDFDKRFSGGLPVNFGFWETYQDEISDGFHGRKTYIGLTGRIINDQGVYYDGGSNLGIRHPLHSISGGQGFPIALLTYTGILNRLPQ